MAERKSAVVPETLLGLHYPATDVPQVPLYVYDIRLIYIYIYICYICSIMLIFYIFLRLLPFFATLR